MKGRALKFGLISGIFFIAWKLLIYFTQNQLNPFGVYSSVLGLLVIFICIFLSIKQQRDRELAGFITFQQAMKTGLLVALVYSALISLFIFIYYKFIDLEYVEYYLGEVQKAMEKENKSPEEITKTITMIREDRLTPFSQATFTLGYSIIAGLFMSFISATFLVKNPPPPSE